LAQHGEPWGEAAAATAIGRRAVTRRVPPRGEASSSLGGGPPQEWLPLCFRGVLTMGEVEEEDDKGKSVISLIFSLSKTRGNSYFNGTVCHNKRIRIYNGTWPISKLSVCCGQFHIFECPTRPQPNSPQKIMIVSSYGNYVCIASVRAGRSRWWAASPPRTVPDGNSYIFIHALVPDH
jgi:hypothetical protein